MRRREMIFLGIMTLISVIFILNDERLATFLNVTVIFKSKFVRITLYILVSLGLYPSFNGIVDYFHSFTMNSDDLIETIDTQSNNPDRLDKICTVLMFIHTIGVFIWLDSKDESLTNSIFNDIPIFDSNFRGIIYISIALFSSFWIEIVKSKIIR